MDSTIKTALLKEQRPLVTLAKRVKTKWIRRFILVLCPLSLILIPSCKKNDWADWKVQNEVWLENNKNQPGVQVTSSGLQYKIIADPLANNGEAVPNLTGTIMCDYTVKLINGYQVDGGNGVTLALSNTISGFAEGCHKVHNQGDIEFYIPAYLGYDQTKYDSNDYYNAEGVGTEGTQAYIPPYSTLIYTVHICAILAN
ncbi:MAG: FKBP-type peptidyl-prolyl cis-trans isomerase [Paludibacteraceae bacterium]|nr:FKBP-type peptidyl-prolyl cis-trans isomerase [Paludibacteraceae bacterium]